MTLWSYRFFIMGALALVALVAVLLTAVIIVTVAVTARRNHAAKKKQSQLSAWSRTEKESDDFEKKS